MNAMLDLTNDFVEPGVFDPANPQPGIYFDVPNEEYHSATSAISNSMLAMAHKSVSALQWIKKAPVDKEAVSYLDFGTAFHAYTLEPERFNEEYAVMPAFNLRTNAGKEKKSKWLADNSDKFVVDEGDLKTIKAMKGSLMADPRAQQWLTVPGHYESTIIWRDEKTGILCRIRPDYLAETDDFVVCVDLKSCADIDKYDRDFFKLRYDVQCAMYTDGLTQHFKKPVLFIFAAVATNRIMGRHPVAIDTVSDEDYGIAEMIYRADLQKVNAAIQNNNWIEYGSKERNQKTREWIYERYSS